MNLHFTAPVTRPPPDAKLASRQIRRVIPFLAALIDADLASYAEVHTVLIRHYADTGWDRESPAKLIEVEWIIHTLLDTALARIDTLLAQPAGDSLGIYAPNQQDA